MLLLSPTFAELSARVEAAGLLAPRRGSYVLRIAANLLLTALCWVSFALVGDSWWQLLVAVALGFSFVQSGFLGHDAGHRQVARSRRAVEVLGLVHMNLLIGAAFGWWVGHHGRHHAEPNNLDRDPDTVRRQVIFAPSELAGKGGTAWRWFVIRFQSVMFFVLLAQEAWRVHAAGFRVRRSLRRPFLELSLVVLHFVLLFGAAFLLLSPGRAVAFLLVSQTVFGCYLGLVFAPNHKGMPVYRGDVELDWLHRQVLTSRNIRPGRLADFVCGGLNYQIEHHLFPSMPRANLSRARPIVRSYCAEHGIPYVEVSAWSSYRTVARFLGSVSAAARS